MRLEVTFALESSDFFNDPILTAPRGACPSTAAEFKEEKKWGPSRMTKLPLRQSLVAVRWEASWVSRSWGYPDIDWRVVYLGFHAA